MNSRGSTLYDGDSIHRVKPREKAKKQRPAGKQGLCFYCVSAAFFLTPPLFPGK